MSATIARQLDLKGLSRPLPIIKTAETIKKLRPGEMVEVLTTDPGSVPDFWAWCHSTGNALMESSRENRVFRFLVRRR